MLPESVAGSIEEDPGGSHVKERPAVGLTGTSVAVIAEWVRHPSVKLLLDWTLNTGHCTTFTVAVVEVVITAELELVPVTYSV